MYKKRVKKSEIEVNFPGFGHHKLPGQFFKYLVILEDYWYVMTGSEQKVLTYILRMTYGWQKQGDKISISQFTDGLGMGNGVGLSRTQVKRAIKQLEKKGFIKVTRYKRRPSYIELPLNEEAKELLEKGVFEDDMKIRLYQSTQNADYMEMAKII